MPYFFIVCLHAASGTNVSVVVNSTCSSSRSKDPVIVTHLPVTLMCCVEGSCPNWTAHWYKESDNGTNQSISLDPTISVNLTKTQETYVCIVSFDSYAGNPFCHDDQHYQGSVKLIKCMVNKWLYMHVYQHYSSAYYRD